MNSNRNRTVMCGMLNTSRDEYDNKEFWNCTLPALHNGPCDDAVEIEPVAVPVRPQSVVENMMALMLAVLIVIVGIPAYILLTSVDALGVEPATVQVAMHHGDRQFRACLSDEGESEFPCVWYAPGMGNGEGHSFRIFRDGRVKRITHRWAFHLLGDCDSNGPIYCRTLS